MDPSSGLNSSWKVLQGPGCDRNLGAVLRRLPTFALLCAWLCASGALLDMAQVFAWTRMFAGYARSESIVAAAKETFDPAKPCALCCAVGKAREASRQHGPAVPAAASERMVLILERPVPFVPASDGRGWPDVKSSRATALSGDVPVPPPKADPA